MSIERNTQWGSAGSLPDDLVWFADDATAMAHLEPLRRVGEPLPPIGLTGGDLFRTVGGRGVLEGRPADDGSSRPGATSPNGARFRVDLGAVLLDGRLRWFIAHCVIRRSWLRGRVIVAANAAFVGSWNLAPRAHPGDGKLELLDADPPIGDRLRARRRLPAGAHLPHPNVAVRRASAVQFELDRRMPVYLDGARIGTARTLSLRVEPDAVEIWIRSLSDR